MSIQVTPGRYRGLRSTSLVNHDVFGIVAFDQRESYRGMMPNGASYDQLVQVKHEIIYALSQRASAILADPIYGLKAAMHMNGESGLLMALDKSGYSGESTYRKSALLDTWTPEKIRKMGANAAKFMVYYNPQNEKLADELDQLIINVVQDCHRWDLPIFLEPMSYSKDALVKKDSPEFAAERPEIVIETARRLSKTGADVLKMEFPIDIKYNDNPDSWRESCEKLSEASKVPWVLLSAGVDYEQFKPQVAIACANGASGFLAGRAIWKECVTMSPGDRQAFLAGIASDRLNELIDIAAVKSRPWTDFYTYMNHTENWFESYT